MLFPKQSSLKNLARVNEINAKQRKVEKCYLLKPLKDYYEFHSCRVIDSELSQKVSKVPQTKTQINAYVTLL